MDKIGGRRKKDITCAIPGGLNGEFSNSEISVVMVENGTPNVRLIAISVGEQVILRQCALMTMSRDALKACAFSSRLEVLLRARAIEFK